MAELIAEVVRQSVADATGATVYREPLVGFASAFDPHFGEVPGAFGETALLPQDILPSARSVVSFFLPFGEAVVEANSRSKTDVAREWVVAYLETNDLIRGINARLLEELSELGVRAEAWPATGRFDRTSLRSPWSHKSVAVIAGLGGFGLHHMVITDAGCAGRFGSLVTEAELPSEPFEHRQVCLHLRDGTCLECVRRCPVGAIKKDGTLDRDLCWERCLNVAGRFAGLGVAEVCGKCATGPCALGAP
jgi:epoxyqueuosine reductase